MIQQDEHGINQDGLDFSEIVCVQCHTVTALSEDVQYNIIEFLKENNLLVTENGLEDEHELDEPGILEQHTSGQDSDNLSEKYNGQDLNSHNLAIEQQNAQKIDLIEPQNQIKNAGGKSIILEEIEGEEMTDRAITNGTNQVMENQIQKHSKNIGQDFHQPEYHHHDYEQSQPEMQSDDLSPQHSQDKTESEEGQHNHLENSHHHQQNISANESDYTEEQNEYENSSQQASPQNNNTNLSSILQIKLESMLCPKHRHKSENFSLYDLDRKIMLCSECVVDSKLRPFPQQQQKQRLRLLKNSHSDLIDDFQERLSLLEDLEEAIQVRQAELSLKERELKRKERELSKGFRFQINEIKGLVDSLVQEVCEERNEMVMDWKLSSNLNYSQSPNQSKLEYSSEIQDNHKKTSKFKNPLDQHKQKLDSKMKQLNILKRKINAKKTEHEKFDQYLNTNCYYEWGFDKKLKEIAGFLDTRNSGRAHYGLDKHLTRANEEKEIIFYEFLNKLISSLELKRAHLFPEKIQNSKIITTPIKSNNQSEMRHPTNSANFKLHNENFNFIHGHPHHNTNFANRRLLHTPDTLKPDSYLPKLDRKPNAMLGIRNLHKRTPPYSNIPHQSRTAHPLNSQISPCEKKLSHIPSDFRAQPSFATRLEQLKRENDISNSNISIVQKNNYNILLNQNKKFSPKPTTDWKSLLQSIKRDNSDFSKLSLKENKFDFNKQKKNSKFQKIFTKMKAEHRSRNAGNSHFRFLS